MGKFIDYTKHDYMYWFEQRLWRGMLLTMPLDTEIKFVCESHNDCACIRAAAASLNHRYDCRRNYKICNGSRMGKEIAVIATRR